jgi:hypothetical protein
MGKMTINTTPYIKELMHGDPIDISILLMPRFFGMFPPFLPLADDISISLPRFYINPIAPNPSIVHSDSQHLFSLFCSLELICITNSYIFFTQSTMDMYTPFLLLFLLLTFSAALVSSNFYSDFDITWGDDRAKILDNGQQLQLTLDRTSGNL